MVSPHELIIYAISNIKSLDDGLFKVRQGQTYIVPLFRLGMHSRVDGISGVEPGCGELERGMVLMQRRERWMQSERGLQDDGIVESRRKEVKLSSASPRPSLMTVRWRLFILS